MNALYDTIGKGYANHRKPDPRIAALIESALGGAKSVINVGAGTGSYESKGRRITAIEPSATMIAQRPPAAAKAIPGTAERLPFPDKSFDAATAFLTTHHWADLDKGLREMKRVTVPGGQVMVLEMTFAPARAFRPLYGVYLRRILPAVARIFARNPRTYYYLADSIRHFPAPQVLRDLMREAGLGPVTYQGLTFGTAYLHIGRVPRGE